MTRMLDILEDYCIYRMLKVNKNTFIILSLFVKYCRIDGDTNMDTRDLYLSLFTEIYFMIQK